MHNFSHMTMARIPLPWTPMWFMSDLVRRKYWAAESTETPGFLLRYPVVLSLFQPLNINQDLISLAFVASVHRCPAVY